MAIKKQENINKSRDAQTHKKTSIDYVFQYEIIQQWEKIII